MIRVKLPMGTITPEQMDAFADAIEKYAPLNKGHITTRQNIQIHHVPLPDAKKFIREIAATGLSSREGCGNTVRNVTGDPFAGVAHDEPFDLTPYAGAYVRYFVRHPTTQLMPRKIKTSFSGTEADVAISKIHDVGFVAKVRDGVRGVEIRVGGGTSIMPRIAPTLYEFVELDNGDYLKVTEACLRIFDRQEWLRVNRARARIKVLVDKVGIETFREMVDDELEGDWVNERDFSIDHMLYVDDEEGTPPRRPPQLASPNGDRSQFERFRESNVAPQRQEGFSTVTVKVTRGDLTPEQFRGLGEIMREFTGGYARTTVQQNFVLRWVRDEAVYEVWRRLDALGLAGSGAMEITDTVSCPGTDSCKLGITSSMGLNRAIQERVECDGDHRSADPRRSTSRCPGARTGAASTTSARSASTAPRSRSASGRCPPTSPTSAATSRTSDVVFGHRLKVRLPSKRVPDAVERWIRHYEAERACDAETFNEFVERVGTGEFEGLIKDLALPAEFNLETMSQFIDWNRSDPYKVERGEGECAI